MYTAEYLRNLKTKTEAERRDDPIQFLVNKYRDQILYHALKGGRRYEIIDIHESNLEITIQKLQEIFIDVGFEIVEYSNPVMISIQKSIVITW
jgi:hypothetical protein